MAKKTMVNANKASPFIESVRDVVRIIHRDRGPIYLAMLTVLEDRSPNEWMLLLGSRTLNEDPGQSIRYITKLLAEKLLAEHATNIRRIGIVGENDPFFVALSSFITVKPFGIAYLQGNTFNNIQIGNGVVFAADQTVLKKEHRRT